MTSPPDKLPLSHGQYALRVVGAILLFICALMVILGSTVLAPQLQGPKFLLYWTWCTLLTCAAIIIALWDMLLVRRAARRTHRELFHKQFMSSDLRDKSRKHPKP
jgi:sterol desaturase/sphingolipid hydroxylase (fatty acid hydroxylase superfamily)